MYGHRAPPRTSTSAPLPLSTSSFSGLSIFAPRPLSAPPVFVSTTPFSSVATVPCQYKIPLHTHATFGGHGDTRSSARNVLSSLSVSRRSYVLSPHDGELHVPAKRSSGVDDFPGSCGVVGAGAALVVPVGEPAPCDVVTVGAGGVASVGAGAPEVVVTGVGPPVDGPPDALSGTSAGLSHPRSPPAIAAQSQNPSVLEERSTTAILLRRGRLPARPSATSSTASHPPPRLSFPLNRAAMRYRASPPEVPRLSLSARPRFILPALLIAASATPSALAQPAAQPAEKPPTQPAAQAEKEPPRNVTPPQVIDHVDAIYPAAELARGVDTNVIVTVTVERDGTVSDAQITTSGGAAFDASALAAVKRWRFAPATKDGKPVRARIRVPFHFSPGPHAPPETPAGHPAEQPVDIAPPKPTDAQAPPATTPNPKPRADQHQPHDHPDDPHDVPEAVAFPHAVAEPGKPIEIHVQGLPSPPRRGGSDFRFDHRVLRAAPHPTAADLLRVAPSVHVMRPEGEAVAQRVILRGFDADHGQDIEFSVGPIPLNQLSHIHGQGYADLNIILPETVRSLRVVEGVYDPRQGDFAVAGSVEYELGVQERGTRLSVGYGSFNTKRAFAMWAPETASEETFAAAAFKASDGFGDGTRGSISGGFTGQYRFELQSDFTALLHAAAYGARAGVAGVVRRDDIDAGNVGFYDTYKDPTARSQSAAASRAQASLTIQRVSDDGSYVTGSVWLARSDFRSRSNFTGFTQRSRINPTWAGSGDLIEQSNGDTGVGARFAYRARKLDPTAWLSAQLTLGADARTEHVEQAQNLLEAPQNETWDRRVDATVRATDVGLYADLLLAASRYARLRGGVRTDLLLFDIDDRLGNFIPAAQEATHIEGFRRTAAGLAIGPRAMLEVDPLPWLRLHAGYGEGYRSPQARQLEEGESAPFAKVRGYEVGARVTAPGSVSITASAYETSLASDLAFDAAEGRLERIGPTTRRGLSVHMTASPIDGFYASVSATFVRATLDSPPPASPENPSPAYFEGQALPFVPPVVVRADVSYDRDLFKIRGEPVALHAGYGATFLSPRPLPYDQESQAVFLVDASLSLRRTFLEIGVDAVNLLNAQYADTELFFVSHWPTREVPSYLPARHIAAGPPLSILGNVTLHL